MSRTEGSREPLGRVLDTSGDHALCELDLAVLAALRKSADPSEQAGSSVGGFVKIAVSDRLLIGTLTDLVAQRSDRQCVLARVDYVGEGMRGPGQELLGFRRGVTLHPHPGDLLQLASRADLLTIFAPRDVPHVEIGMVHPMDNVRASVLFDRLMSRHFAVVGATGTGKSTLVTLLLNQITSAAPEGHIVILDPHGEYSRAFDGRASVLDVDSLHIPYWLMNLEEHCEAFVSATGDGRTIDANILAKCLTEARMRHHGDEASRITADSPVAYDVNDLLDILLEEGGRLEKSAETHHYTRMRSVITQYFADHRYRFVFNKALWNHSLEEFLGELLRIPSARKPISIIDLAGIPTEIVNVVISLLSRVILDWSIQTPQDSRTPVLLVCEEAHRYLPSDHHGPMTSVQRQLNRVAREGRKYGVALGIVTQRPSELSETALSQCGTIITMRLNNARDQAYLKAALPEGAQRYVNLIPALQNQECIVAGEGVPVPMHVRVDTLPTSATPASDDPLFSERWKHLGDGEAVLAETVRKWRGNG